jgi:hypothetical protein
LLNVGAICGTAGVVEAVVMAEAKPDGLGAPALGVGAVFGTMGAGLKAVVLPEFPNAPTNGIVGVIVVAIFLIIAELPNSG